MDARSDSSSRLIRRILPFCLLLGVLFSPACGARKPAPTPYLGTESLAGEWAIEWEDRKEAYRETIYAWLSQDGESVSGTALDPNLIPATVTGERKSGKVTLSIAPEHGLGFRPPQPPTSVFNGTLTGPHTIEGEFRVPGLKGTWRAVRTPTGNKRSVTVTSESKVSILLTSEEYDRLYSFTPPYNPYDLATKNRLREGDLYRVTDSIGKFGGWLYHYKLLGDFARIGLADESRKERSLQAKILEALNQNGYPWKTIPGG